MQTTVPFSGFYESIHSAEIDRAVEQMISDSSGCHAVSDRIADDIWQHTGDVSAKYAEEFLKDFDRWFRDETELDVRFKWDALDSPSAYNFTTDRIFARISRADVRKMYKACDKTLLDKIIADRFTSCSGFISYYTPDRQTWGTIDKWDHNQIACIVQALVDATGRDNWEWGVVEDWSGNGYLDEWVYAALDEEGKRLVEIASYLREREERKF